MTSEAKTLRQAFEEKLVLANMSPATVETYDRAVLEFLRFIDKDVQTVSQITLEDVNRFMLSIADKADKTRRLRAVVLRNFLKSFNDPRYKEIAVPKIAKTMPETVSKESIFKMIDAAKTNRDKAIIHLYYATGLRREELRQLNLEDVNFEKNTIRVKFGKEQKERIVIFTEEAKQRLLAYLTSNSIKDPAEPLFQTKPKTRISKSEISYMFRETAKKAGLRGITPHKLRHSFATDLSDEINILHLRDLLGHTSIQTTEIYLHSNPKKMMKAYEEASSALSPESQCPRCSGKVESGFIICADCGFPLKRLCHSCNKPLNQAWKYCPYCAAKPEVVLK